MSHCPWLLQATASALMLPTVVMLIQVILIGQVQGAPNPPSDGTLQQQRSQPPLGSMCFGFAAVPSTSAPLRRSTCASVTLSLRMQSGGRKKQGGRGGQRGGRGGNRSDRTARRDSEQDDEDEEISTYVTCPKCMADSFIKAEVLGDSKRLKCNNCDRSFNATADQLRDINAVYSSPSPPSPGQDGGFTEESFFEMFGDKKTLKPPT